jgi:hypothetical protein
MISMGIGQLGFNNTIFKRKFRYTFSAQTCAGLVPEWYVKTSARPNLAIDETEINFLNSKMFIPGKPTWETITLTYIDAVNPSDSSNYAPLWGWLSSNYNFTDPIGSIRRYQMGSSSQAYGALGTITLYDGCGSPLEQWQLANMWPTAVDFGELDYGSSEECTISLTLRYSDVLYTPLCPQFPITPCCFPCGN